MKSKPNFEAMKFEPKRVTGAQAYTHWFLPSVLNSKSISLQKEPKNPCFIL
jgi:hypothetical protein